MSNRFDQEIVREWLKNKQREESNPTDAIRVTGRRKYPPPIIEKKRIKLCSEGANSGLDLFLKGQAKSLTTK